MEKEPLVRIVEIEARKLDESLQPVAKRVRVDLERPRRQPDVAERVEVRGQRRDELRPPLRVVRAQRRQRTFAEGGIVRRELAQPA